MSNNHEHPNTSYSENIIIWEKWSDPYSSDIDIDDAEDEDGALDPYHSEQVYEDPEANHTSKKIIKFKAIATPMGIIPIDETTDSGKIFNFWIGHTNFDITYGVGSIIDNFPGVETLDIFTRYRFRIGIGKAFNDSEVMRNINQSVYEYLT